MKKLLQKVPPQYNCPFCKRDIASSKKTEVFYRSHWINGCNECFDLSISELTMREFQTENY